MLASPPENFEILPDKIDGACPIGDAVTALEVRNVCGVPMVPGYIIRFFGGPWHNRTVGVWAFRAVFFAPETEPPRPGAICKYLRRQMEWPGRRSREYHAATLSAADMEWGGDRTMQTG